MKKQILLISMMLTIVGVNAQGVDSVNATLNTDLKKDYFMVRLTFTHGTAPFDITLNGHHVDLYNLYCSYDTNNIIIITDANNTSRTFNIYEPNPDFMWKIGYHDSEYTDLLSGILYNKKGVTIGYYDFDDRYKYDIEWYSVSNHAHIESRTNYESVSDSIWSYIHYSADEVPVGIYSVRIRDKVHDMDTVVFVEITNPSDTTTTDTTTTDTTQHLNVTLTQIVDDVEFYPNPTSDFCNTSEMLREVCIFSSKGDLVRVYKNTNRISLAGLSAGSYLIRYTTLDGKTTNSKKIIKK